MKTREEEDRKTDDALESLVSENARIRKRIADALESFGFQDDSADYLRDEPGEWIAGWSGRGRESNFYSEEFFIEARNLSRRLYRENPFAVGAIENRIDYVVGHGHHGHVVPLNEDARPLAERVQREIDVFMEENRWQERQQEIQRRKDRDGEAFLRFFRDGRGRLTVRFVDPERIYTPSGLASSEADSFGIRTDPDDVENVIGYWIDEKFVAAASIQHRKTNVDANVKRGIPLLWPVRRNLVRIEKLLRNMSVVAEIQSAIALIRKHSGASAESVRQYLRNQTAPNPATGDFRQKLAPGTIIDSSGSVEYQFPIAAIDASRYIQILQAELRAVASRLVMPEYMISGDASNASYSSTAVAEGPAIRMFERLQAEMVRNDIDVFRRVVAGAILRGDLPSDVQRFVSLQSVPPTLAVRDRLSEAKADEILLKNGVLSPQTMAMRYGLDPDQETKMKGPEGNI